jgi:spore coat protein A
MLAVLRRLVAAHTVAIFAQRFRVARRATEDSLIPERLADIEPLDRAQATVNREFSFRGGRIDDQHGWTIDGLPYSPTRVETRPRLGDVEIWRFVADLHHPIHEAVELIARFDGYRCRYMFHWHNVEHEDMGMMANFEVG